MVLEHLLARRAFVPTAGLLRQARAPRIAHALIDAGAPVDGYDPPSPSLGRFMEDATPLAVAVIHRDKHRLDVAAVLLERGASLEARDGFGRTPMIVAAEWGRAAPVRWLLERGAKLDCAPPTRSNGRFVSALSSSGSAGFVANSPPPARFARVLGSR